MLRLEQNKKKFITLVVELDGTIQVFTKYIILLQTHIE